MEEQACGSATRAHSAPAAACPRRDVDERQDRWPVGSAGVRDLRVGASRESCGWRLGVLELPLGRGSEEAMVRVTQLYIFLAGYWTFRRAFFVSTG